MRLEKIASIKQGITLSRIRFEDEMETEERKVYSFEKESKIKVPKNLNKVDQNIPQVIKGMILFNMVSYNAKKATENDIGKIVSSNYVMITVTDKNVDSDYLAWYMDQGESFKRELFKIIQGSAVLSLPINEFRQMSINLPELEFQKRIGNINRLNSLRKKLFLEREELIQKSVTTINEGEILNG